jgi:DNA-directed RNA polymerase specialized sigma24 family protein
MLPLIDTRQLRPAQTALSLNLVSEMDFLRLKAVARLYARGLPPDVDWDDLLQEAFTRVLVGTRVQPDGIAIVPFIAGIIRSLRSSHLRRTLGNGSSDAVQIDDATEPGQDLALLDPAPGPERSLIARQELDVIRCLFADDPIALEIIKGLGDGMTAEQIRAVARISKLDYDSARKRMRRCLLREGLTCAPK